MLISWFVFVLIAALKTPKPNCYVIQFYVEKQLSVMHGGKKPKQVFLDEWEDLKFISQDFFGSSLSPQ